MTDLHEKNLAGVLRLLVILAAALLSVAGVPAQEGQPPGNPDGAEAVRERAFAELRAGRWTQADRLFDTIPAKPGEDPATTYGRALAKFNVGKVDEADVLLESATAILDKGGSAGRLLAECLVLSAIIDARKGDNQSAVAKLRKAVAIEPGNFDAVLSLARGLYGNGDLKGAEEYFRKAVALRPGDLRARFFLASALENLGESENALKEYRAIVKADPNHLDGNLGLGVLLLKTEGDSSVEGVNSLLKVISLNGRNYEARITLGKALVRRGDIQEAVTHLKVASELAPSNPEPFYQLAIAYRKLGMKDEAAKATETVRRIHEARRGVPDNR